jgi:hypothetical protein
MKKLIILTILALLLNVSGIHMVAYAAPPTLNLGGVGGDDDDDDEEEEEESAPPSLNLGGAGGDDDDDDDDDDDGETPNYGAGSPVENPAPPANNEAIRIVKSGAFPKVFNPVIDATEIAFELSNTAKVEVRITNSSDSIVTKLLSGSIVTAGEHAAVWFGTTNGLENGPVVAPGAYKYVIILTDPDTGEVKDSVQGRINVVLPAAPGTSTSKSSAPPSISLPGGGSSNSTATSTLHNSGSGVRIAQTGPAVAVYALAPLFGWIYRKRRK